MKVRVIRSFSGMLNGQMFAHSEGDVFELPAGVDWLQAGFVVPVVVPVAKERRPGKRPRSAKATE